MTVERDHREVDHARADRLRHRGAEAEGGDEVEERGPDHRLPGDSTRVDTTVAIELAASWKPLMKSKIRATAISARHCQQRGDPSAQPCLTTTPSSRLPTSSQRSVAASRKSKISFHLMTVIGSRLLVEELDDAVLVHAVGFMFELVDSRRELQDAVALLERAERLDHAIDRLSQTMSASRARAGRTWVIL